MKEYQAWKVLANSIKNLTLSILIAHYISHKSLGVISSQNTLRKNVILTIKTRLIYICNELIEETARRRKLILGVF